MHYIPNDSVYFRYTDKEYVMVVINNNITGQKLNLKRFSEGLKTTTKDHDILSGKDMVLSRDLDVTAKFSLILELK